MIPYICCLMRLIQSRLNKPRGKLFALFVDFSEAFDSVPHNNLWYKLEQLGINSQFYKTCTNLQIANRFIDRPIAIPNGVLQGEILSPILFNLFLSDITFFLEKEVVNG